MTAEGDARTVVLHCPFCAEEDLRPAEAWLDESPSAWACQACRRAFTVRLLGPVDRPVRATPRTPTEAAP